MKLLTILLLVFNANTLIAEDYRMNFSFTPAELTLSDFNTDGCSSYPDGIFLFDPNRWVHCCITHDMAYWVGGDKSIKKAADKELNRCVSEATNPTHGFIMETGVAAGGLPNTPFPWRWGYGWNKGVSYNDLTEEMKEMALEKFDSILDALIDRKEWLNHMQRGYVLARYEYLRHEAFEKKSYEYEMATFEERLELVKEFLK